MPRGRKRNIFDQNNPESGDDLIFNSKNLEVLVPEKFDATVAVNSNPLSDNESIFINPVHILQMFHDQNNRIKVLENRLEQQQQQIKNQQGHLEKQRTDIEIQQQDIAIHQLEIIGKQKEETEKNKNKSPEKKPPNLDEMAGRTDSDDNNFQKFMLKRVINCENSVAEFETKMRDFGENQITKEIGGLKALPKKRKRTLINSEMTRLNRNIDSSDGELRSPKLPVKLSKETADIPERTDISVPFSKKIDNFESQIKKIMSRLVTSEGNISFLQKSDRKDEVKQLNENQEELAARCTIVKNIADLNSERIRELLTDVAKLPVSFKNLETENAKTSENSKTSENAESIENTKVLVGQESTDAAKVRYAAQPAVLGEIESHLAISCVGLSEKITNLEKEISNNKKLLFEKFELCIERVKVNSKCYKNIESTLASKHQEAIDIINKHSSLLNDCEPSDLNRENFQLDLFGKPAPYEMVLQKYHEKGNDIKLLFWPLNQCCETAPHFFMAYGLWRVMAFVFMAYGRKSKFDEKAINRTIRRNTARLGFLSANPAKCSLFWRFFRKFSCF